MKKKACKTLTIISSITLVILVYAYLHLKYKQNLILHCVGDWQILSSYDGKGKGKFVNLNVNYFFYNDNTGVRTYLGKVTIDGVTYNMDRNSRFNYEKVAGDTNYTITIEKTERLNLDNYPEKFYYNNLYAYRISFYKIFNDIYYLKERGLPFLICTSS